MADKNGKYVLVKVPDVGFKLGNSPIELEISNGGMIGTVKIKKAGLEWWNKGAKKPTKEWSWKVIEKQANKEKE
ncbi:hypothetical protein [Ferrovibrio sp.]|uniref:hypothetical protein n=1 Tax=Ferrovibrio sp. TaxID=1917215 RepID=UPI003D2AB11E